MKVRDVISLIESDGWVQVRTKGSHRQFRHPTKPGIVTVAGKPSVDWSQGLRGDDHAVVARWMAIALMLEPRRANLESADVSPNKPVPPTRAAEAFGEREPSRCVIRAPDHHAAGPGRLRSTNAPPARDRRAPRAARAGRARCARSRCASPTAMKCTPAASAAASVALGVADVHGGGGRDAEPREALEDDVRDAASGARRRARRPPRRARRRARSGGRRPARCCRDWSPCRAATYGRSAASTSKRSGHRHHQLVERLVVDGAGDPPRLFEESPGRGPNISSSTCDAARKCARSLPRPVHRRQAEPRPDRVVVGDVGVPGIEQHAVAIEDDRSCGRRHRAHRCAITASANSSVPAVPPRSRVRTVPSVEDGVVGLLDALAERFLVQVVQHHHAAHQAGERIRDALAGDVGRRAVHGLEHRRVVADVGARHHAEPAHQPGAQVAHQVAVEVLHQEDVEAGRGPAPASCSRRR